MMTQKKPLSVNYGRCLELLAVFIIIVSVIGIATMRLGVFDAQPIWMASLLITCGYGLYTKGYYLDGKDIAPAWHLLLVLGVGLLFRLSPYVWLLGGQDQGVYVNMGMELARTGALEPVDQIIGRIADPILSGIYRHSNYGSAYLPGVYSYSHGLMFQFYHLFPVWLALFGDIFGVGGSVYALTFLSLTSLVFFYRIAHLITGKPSAGLVAGLLLAANPLHAFFSKFPVTEVPTLAFSLIAFSFLLMYWQAVRLQKPEKYLAISALALGLLFMTRISGFMYIPVILLISIASIVFVDEKNSKRSGLLLWAGVVIFLYALSVFYGLKWSTPYSKDIYNISFRPILGEQWEGCISLIIIVVFVFFGSLWLLIKSDKSLRSVRNIAMKTSSLFPIALFIFAALALYKAYVFGYTDKYVADPMLGKRWDLANKGISSVFTTSIPVSAIYLSPFILMALFIAGLKNNLPPTFKILLFFVICFFGHLSLLQWVIPYQPYYARYLLSEFVPYALLFIVCVWAICEKNRLRFAISTALVLGGCFTAILCFAQLGKQEQGGVQESIERLVKNYDSGDVVLLGVPGGGPQLATALIYSYGLNVVRVSVDDIRSEKYLNALASVYDDVFLLTVRDGTIPNFIEIDSTRFVRAQFNRGLLPPLHIDRDKDTKINKYKYIQLVLPSYSPLKSSEIELLDGWSKQEPWGVWTGGASAKIRVAMGNDVSKYKGRILKISGQAYVTPRKALQNIIVSVEGKTIAEIAVSYPKRGVVIELPLAAYSGKNVFDIVIDTPNAVSPASLGHSGDKRTLAFGLQKIETLSVSDRR